ncbi:MAG: DUF4832 domain-containing protein [Paludibacteraceae bacterium]|nr:DUF4832 domain-containing protein [Paludibacteraceae bacterium]
MKKTFVLVLLAVANFAMASTVNYTVDDDTWFRNPERGWYHQSACHPQGNGRGGGLGSWNKYEIDESRSLLLRIYYMEYYNNGRAITESDLNMFASDLAQARQNGIKLILRFAYGDSGYKDDNNWSFTEPTKAQMMAHMDQIKPILAKNADVIACIQAGFAGIWGEWYYTSTFGKDWSKSNAVNDRNDLINKLLEMTPADRSLQLRTVHYITEYMGKGIQDYSSPLTDKTAFSGSAQSRLGHHNDAICADAYCWGTFYYDDEFAYLANLSQYVPIGGESAGGDWNYYNGPKAYAFFEKYHYDYINRDYHSGVIDSWFNDSKDGKTYFDHITCRLGYRYALVSGTYADKVASGDKLAVTLKIKNGGFSALYNKRTAYIVLKNGSKSYKLALASDPRLWKAGQTTTVSESLTVPANATAGKYDLYLWLPDEYKSLQGDARYSVRMANKDMTWTDGMNKLNASVTITNEGGGGQEEQGGGDEDPTHDYAISVDFVELAAQYAPYKDHSTNGIQTELDEYNYSVSSATDGKVYWDNQDGPDGGFGIDNTNGTQHPFSFWVKANCKVTITVGTLNGDGTPNTATLTMNDGSPVTINQNTTTEYTTTEPTLFVLTMLPGSKDWSWNRIQQITITPLPATLLPAARETAPAVGKYLDGKGQLHIVREGHHYNAFGL